MFVQVNTGQRLDELDEVQPLPPGFLTGGRRNEWLHRGAVYATEVFDASRNSEGGLHMRRVGAIHQLMEPLLSICDYRHVDCPDSLANSGPEYLNWGTMYQPILKGKKAEFEAWRNVSSARRNVTIPLFEVIANKGVDYDLGSFSDAVFDCSQAGDILAVDSHALGEDAVDTTTSRSPYSLLALNAASSGVRLRPVVHLGDGAGFISDAVTAAGATREKIVLRVGGSEADPAPGATDVTLKTYCRDAGVSPGDVHLLIDFASVHGSALDELETMAATYLAWADRNGTWASVTLASGAFPSQITSLPKKSKNLLRRLDAEMWNAAVLSSPIADIHYGDYGVRHPDLPDSGFGGPIPNLRYCTDSAWIVWREAKLAKFPHGSFYDVCRAVVATPEYSGAAHSWGDGVIDAKSKCVAGPAAGAGGGTEWIMYGMNRHISYVADRLSSLGVA